MNNYNCTINPKTTCDNMLYFQDNQLNTFSTMDYCSHLKIRMALAELIYVFSYLNLNQEMPDNKCLFSEKKKVSWNILIGFSLSPQYLGHCQKVELFYHKGVNLFGIVIFATGEQSTKSAKILLRPRKSHTTLRG